MSKVAQVVGIDPGLVHTGCVRMVFDVVHRTIQLDHLVVDGLDVQAAKTWIDSVDRVALSDIFIEEYRPRHNLSSDKRMVDGVQQFRRGIPGSLVLSNTGITKVVPTTLMNLLGVWDWPQSTHHQDLRSAARIALLGMMKKTRLNEVLSTTVRDHLAGLTWEVTRL
jgi:hypothetical protein